MKGPRKRPFCWVNKNGIRRNYMNYLRFAIIFFGCADFKVKMR